MYKHLHVMRHDTKIERWKSNFLCLHVPLHVQRKVIGARECPLAQVALERPVTGVLSIMTSQLVRPREFPPAAFPIAMVWLLAYG